MAIVTAASKIPAQIGAFGRAKQSKFEGGGVIQSLKAISNDGTTEHWFTLPVEQARGFKMGQPVNLIPATRKGRDTFDIEPLGDAPAPQRPMGFQAAPPVQPVQPPAQLGTNHAVSQEVDQKRAIADFIKSQSKLYGYCLSQATVALPDGADNETIRCAASAVFISANRRFNLER